MTSKKGYLYVYRMYVQAKERGIYGLQNNRTSFIGLKMILLPQLFLHSFHWLA